MNAKVIPLRPDDDEDLPSIADILPESALSEQSKMLVEYASRKGGRLPKSLTKGNIKDNFDKCFEMIGGLPRLAIWADQNPSLFYAHYGKLLPAQFKVEQSLPQVDMSDPTTIPTAQLRQILIREAMALAQATDVEPTTAPTPSTPDTSDE